MSEESEEAYEEKYVAKYSTISKLNLGKRDVVVIRTKLPINMVKHKKINAMNNLKDRMEKALRDAGMENPVVVIDGNVADLEIMTPEEIFTEKL